jgi:hypothetical protein
MKLRCVNKFQKAAHRPGEQRVDRETIGELLELSRSENAEERETAAKFLCPCHVRRRIEDVWQALYRMLEDSDVRVRRAAWHTLEDGGRPEDPKLDEILERTLKNEIDRTVRNFAEKVSGPRKDKELAVMRMTPRSTPKRRGKCDFCGKSDVMVELDLDTMIPSGSESRAALVCEKCSA